MKKEKCHKENKGKKEKQMEKKTRGLKEIKIALRNFTVVYQIFSIDSVQEIIDHCQ